MKKISILILAFCVFSVQAFADCDYSKVVDNGNGTYTYSKALHICVGQSVQDNETKDQQINDYKKAIDLKDLALDKADQRSQLWMDTSLKLEDRMQKIDSYEKTNEWIYFGLGALTVFAAGMAAAKLAGR